VSDAPDGVRAVEGEARVFGHVDCHPKRRSRGALADPNLEEPELSLIDRELDVAHVAEGTLERCGVAAQLGGNVGQSFLQGRDRLGRVVSGDHVLALGREENVAVRDRVAGGRVSGEEDAGRRIQPPIAEDHDLHGDRRTEVIGNALDASVGAGAVAVP
jgi:hypothetical protein